MQQQPKPVEANRSRRERVSIKNDDRRCLLRRRPVSIRHELRSKSNPRKVIQNEKKGCETTPPTPKRGRGRVPFFLRRNGDNKKKRKRRDAVGFNPFIGALFLFSGQINKKKKPLATKWKKRLSILGIDEIPLSIASFHYEVLSCLHSTLLSLDFFGARQVKEHLDDGLAMKRQLFGVALLFFVCVCVCVIDWTARFGFRRR